MAMEALFEDDVLDDRELLANQTTESAERAVVVLTDEDSDDADFDDSSGRPMDEEASEREDEDEDEGASREVRHGVC